MTKCSHTGCATEADFIPMLCVPAKMSGQCIQIMFNVPLCNEHVADIKVPECIDDNLKDIINYKTRNKRPPDYSRAYVLRRSFNSHEVITFLEQHKIKNENADTACAS